MVIHHKKHRPALQRRDILTVSLVIVIFVIGNLLNPSSTEFLVVLFFIAFCTVPFFSKKLLFRAFSSVFVYPAILLSGFAPFTT